MVMIKVDTLEQAKKEGRALEQAQKERWSVLYDSKDMVWYNDGFVAEGHSLIVPKEATQERIIRCVELAIKIRK